MEKIVILVVAASIAVVLSDPSRQDKEAMESIKRFLLQHNPNNTRLKQWLDNTDNPCLWRGIECDYFINREVVRVRRLNLSDAALSGPLPPALANLTALAHLILANNKFTGTIPNNLSGLLDYSLEILDLSSNNITGEVSSLLFSVCRRLKILNLSGNVINGSLPAELKNCKNLTTLNLSSNRLTGGIPSPLFSICSRLEILNLSSNAFTGRLPAELKNCKILVKLLLSQNNLTGNIPEGFLDNCRNLTEVDLEFNNLTGTIPEVHVSCSSLTALRLAFNQLTGQLPKELAKLSKLQTLALGKNGFTGTIPVEFGSLKALQLLSIEGNRLYGSIPPSVGNMVSLQTLLLHKNNLNTTIPKELSSLSRLRILDLNDNNFTGTIPPELGEIRTLNLLFIASNFLTGTIPPEIGNLTELKALDLSDNRLSGSIPSTISNLQSLLWFTVSRNQLEGHLPAEIVSCSSLIWLNVAHNRLSGPIPRNIGLIGAGADKAFARNTKGPPVLPETVGECWAMAKWFPENNPFIYDTFMRIRCKDFWLHFFQGTMPAPMCINDPKNVQAPAYIQLSGNRFTGTIPESLGNYSRLGALLLANNLLSDNIPEAITALSDLIYLNLSNNNLSGAIPEALGRLTCLNLLDLSHNDLEGVIPGTLANLTSLSKFNISYNRNLRGPVPTRGQFLGFCPQSYLGDTHLFFDSGQCTKNNTNNTSSNAPEVSRSNPLKGWAIGGICIAAAAGIIIASTLFCLFQTRDRGSILPKSGSSKHIAHSERTYSSVEVPPGAFTYANIVAATDNFSEARCIGRGGQGVVYRAELENGLQVAVKNLSHEDPQADVEFLAEMQTLGGLSHPNLVPLLGCCLRGNQRILVYKLIENGSLEEWLHEPPGVLEWAHRMKIALGCSLALRFLHHECPSVIIHRDIKATNVLLDDDFKAFVADFGLARNQSKDMTHVSTTVAGTLGYVPPEYSYSWKATTKGDVYSFGVILMQLATGMRAIGVDDDMAGGLVVWVTSMVGQGKSHALFDPRVVESDTWDEESGVRLLRVACECTRETPHLRPSMIQVASALHHIINDSPHFHMDRTFT